MNSSSENHKYTKRKFYYNLIKNNIRLYLKIVFTTFLLSGIGIALSYFLKVLVDSIIPNNLIHYTDLFFVIFFLSYLIQTLITYFRKNLVLTLSQKLDFYLLNLLYNRILKLDISFFQEKKIGEIIGNFKELSKIRDSITALSVNILFDVILLITSFIIIGAYSKLILIYISCISILYIGIIKKFHHIHIYNQKKIFTANSKLNSFLITSFQGIETIKSLNMNEKLGNDANNKLIDLLESIKKGGKSQINQDLIKSLIDNFTNIIVLWVGCKQIFKGDLSMGELLLINTLIGYFMAPLKNLINIQFTLQSAIITMDRFLEIFNIDTELVIKNINLDFNTAITFKNIDFNYEKNKDKKVLNNINLEIKKGEKIAIIGESGSGKSTLIKLLLGFYKPTEGEILIDNQNINMVGVNNLREIINYVPQNTYIFNDTLLKNISIENKNMKVDNDILKIMKIEDIIKNSCEGYNYILDEYGSNLSGGQKQRISIARTLLSPNDIIVFDEATSNLDNILEHNLIKYIKEDLIDKTVIFITHNLNNISDFSKIIVLDKGKIEEVGTHNNLIDKKGKYYELWTKSQNKENLLT